MNPWLKLALGAILGAGLGFLYYKLVGCRSGACPLAGNPWISSLWWGIIGALMGSSIR